MNQTFEIKPQETVDGTRYLIRFKDSNFNVSGMPHQATFYGLTEEALHTLSGELRNFLINELE